MAELLLLVNEDDEVIGYGEKIETHIRKKRHRAFSIFIIEQERKRILLQKRAEKKYHSGGLWSNSCCSHWRKDETVIESIIRCVKDELGIVLPNDLMIKNYSSEDIDKKDIIYAGKFTYFSEYETLAEYEIDYVFLIFISNKEIDRINPNPDEIQDIKWVDKNELELQIERNPKNFTSWFQKAYCIVSALDYLSI